MAGSFLAALRCSIRLHQNWISEVNYPLGALTDRRVCSSLGVVSLWMACQLLFK